MVAVMVGLLAGCGGAPAPGAETPRAAPTARLLPLPSATPARTEAGATAGAAATPVIIASPTPTATPVTHQVAEGETLLGIAIRYGVSLENLQAANPDVNPRFLSIGTVLVIPPPEGGFAAGATQLAPPPPAPVEVGEPQCYALASSGLYCLLEAANPGETAIENVSVRLTLAGADGLPMASAVAYAALDLIPPGGRAPMAALFLPPPERPVLATGVEVLTGNLALEPAPAGRAVVLATRDVRGGPEAGRWLVTGLAVNESERAAGETWAALTLYGEGGEIVGYRKQWIGGPLGPGESQAFVMEADVLGGAAASFAVLAEGYP